MGSDNQFQGAEYPALLHDGLLGDDIDRGVGLAVDAPHLGRRHDPGKGLQHLGYLVGRDEFGFAVGFDGGDEVPVGRFGPLPGDAERGGAHHGEGVVFDRAAATPPGHSYGLLRGGDYRVADHAALPGIDRQGFARGEIPGVEAEDLEPGAFGPVAFGRYGVGGVAGDGDDAGFVAPQGEFVGGAFGDEAFERHGRADAGGCGDFVPGEEGAGGGRCRDGFAAGLQGFDPDRDAAFDGRLESGGARRGGKPQGPTQHGGDVECRGGRLGEALGTQQDFGVYLDDPGVEIPGGILFDGVADRLSERGVLLRNLGELHGKKGFWGNVSRAFGSDLKGAGCTPEPELARGGGWDGIRRFRTGAADAAGG